MIPFNFSNLDEIHIGRPRNWWQWFILLFNSAVMLFTLGALAYLLLSVLQILIKESLSQ